MLPARERRRATTAQPTLLERLGDALRAGGVACCQWRGHWKRTRWETGAGDVDLLVDHASAERLEGVLDQLGFKPALPPSEAEIPGLASWFGYDARRNALLHIHVHFRLIIGGYWSTVYRLPIERAVLESAAAPPAVPPARSRTPFPVPAPDVEFILFVLRQVQRYSVRDIAARGDPVWLHDIQQEYAYLLAHVDRGQLVSRLAQLVPAVDVAFFDACARSLRPGASRWGRLKLRWGLHRRLRPHAYPPPPSLLVKRIMRRLGLFPRPPGMRLARGGTVFALVGGDGAGKSTCVAELRGWLGRAGGRAGAGGAGGAGGGGGGGPFHVITAHLGRPPRSLTTLVVGGLRKITAGVERVLGDAPPNQSGMLDLLRLVCTARDRYHLFVKARRVAAAGGIALCERYPIPENRLLVGPEIARLLGHGRDTGLARTLLRAELWYYRRITPPDAVLVLMVDPEVAVCRKTNEPPDYVRARARIIWETDWSDTGARLLDAGRSLPEVLADLKTYIWAGL